MTKPMRKRRKFGIVREVPRNIWEYSIGIIGESGIGKDQPLTSTIITPDGLTTMGNIQVGDEVIGEDGKAHKVLGVFPQGIRPVYKVEFSDGSVVECGIEHLWKVQERDKRGTDEYTVKTLEEIMYDYDQGNGYKYSVPLPEPVRFRNSSKLPVPPYLLGALIGDGCLLESTVLINNSEMDIKKKVAREFKKGYPGGQTAFYSQGRMSLKKNTQLKKDIADLGLNIRSRERFIPQEYMFASIKERTELLEGLIDTDGSVSGGVSLRYSTFSGQLAQDVRFIAKSLGFASTVKEYHRFNGDIEYVVGIMGDVGRLKLSKKHSEKIKPRKHDYLMTIRNIEYKHNTKTQCIMVENPTSLYLTDDFIVTHNTTIMKEACETLVGRSGYIILDIGREDGTKSIAGIVAEKVTTFEHQLDALTGEKKQQYAHMPGVGFLDIVDDVIEYKDEVYPDLKVIVIDTLDQFIDIGEKYIVKKYRSELKQQGKQYRDIHSINQAYGGFMGGQAEVIEEISAAKDRLEAVGVQLWFTGHTKVRTRTDTLSGLEYDVLTNDMKDWYFNKIKAKLHFLGVIAIDRSIDQEVTKGFMDKVVVKGTIADEKRIIKFRDDNFSVDGKSRFAEIVPEIPYGADNFLGAIQDAIDKERAKDLGVDPSVIQRENAVREANAASVKAATQSIVSPNRENTSLETNELTSGLDPEEKKALLVNLENDLKQMPAASQLKVATDIQNEIIKAGVSSIIELPDTVFLQMVDLVNKNK